MDHLDSLFPLKNSVNGSFWPPNDSTDAPPLTENSAAFPIDNSEHVYDDTQFEMNFWTGKMTASSWLLAQIQGWEILTISTISMLGQRAPMASDSGIPRQVKHLQGD